MRTIILGQARTGTTALFLQLQAALPAQIPCFFEPQASELPATGDVLVKSLVMSLPDDLRRPALDTSSFDQRYVLIRDPRDRLISVLLFLLHWHSATYPPLWQCAPTGLEAILRLLHRKEHDPTSVTVAQLFHAILWVRFSLNHWQALDRWHRLQAGFLAVHAALPQQETIRYETLVAHPLAPPSRAYASIFRTGTVGAWRQWFTPEDVSYFRPLLLPYLHCYHYTDCWGLPAQQTIDPTYSSRYVEKWVRVQRRAAGVRTVS